MQPGGGDQRQEWCTGTARVQRDVASEQQVQLQTFVQAIAARTGKEERRAAELRVSKPEVSSGGTGECSL